MTILYIKKNTLLQLFSCLLAQIYHFLNYIYDTYNKYYTKMIVSFKGQKGYAYGQHTL